MPGDGPLDDQVPTPLPQSPGGQEQPANSRGAQRRERMYAVLVTLGHQLSAADTDEAAARIIARVADTIFEWDSYALALYNTQDDLIRGVLYLDLVGGRRVEAAPKAPAIPPSEVARRTIVDGPQLILRTAASGNVVGSEPFGDTGRLSASLMFVPIRSGTTIVGILSVQSYLPQTYDHEDLMTLQVLADYCGGALVRIAAQAAQSESEAHFRMLFEHSPDAIFLIDPHDPSGAWPIVDCNDVAGKMNGYDRHELVGFSLNLLRTRPTDAVSDTTYLADLRNGRTLQFETENRRKDQTLVAIECSASYITVGGRNLVFEIDRDISERKLVEARLRLRDQISAALTESLEYQSILQRVAHLMVPAFADWCGIDMIQLDGTLQRIATADQDFNKDGLASKAAREFSAHPSMTHATLEVLRTSTPRLFPTIATRVAAIASDLAEAAQPEQIDRCSAMIVPLLARGRTLGAVVLATAQSARHFAQADLTFVQDLAARTALAVDNARLYREAQIAIGARDEFLSIAAHELRTPLTALYGYTQMLHDHTEKGEPLRAGDHKAVHIVFKQAERLNRLINTLLDLSRIETGHFSLSREPLDLVELIYLVVGEVLPILDQHTLTVELAPGTDALMIDGDAQRLEQVFLNLLQNAVKYSPGGGAILLRVERQPAWVQITVTDSGIGIHAVDQPHLFERFYRAHSAKANFVKGMGIGLYVVKEIVTRHGGTVEVSSKEWQGSIFTVHLPLLVDS